MVEAEGASSKVTARKTERESGPPPHAPAGTPTAPYLHPDQHSWILQSVGEMRESIGGLKRAVETLSEQSKENTAKLNSISHRVYAATIVMGLLGGLVAFLGWIISNLGGVIVRALDVLAHIPPR
ncbi:MAG: hypothetical protein ACR2L2_14855 [Acidobacteriota bacterium]